MNPLKKKAVGLYLDSSATGVHACFLETDGLDILTEPICLTRPYSKDLKERILSLKYPDDFVLTPPLKELDERITEECLTAFDDLKNLVGDKFQPDIIGFSAQRLYHNPDALLSIHLGNADILASKTGIPVINRFIHSDLKAGGRGGPIFPSFLEARTRGLEKPLAVVALRGITTLTYIGAVGELQAFDVGAGSVLLDLWMQRKCDLEHDFDGTYAARGKTDDAVLTRLLKHPFLRQKPPKTTDRRVFYDVLEHLEGLTPADGAATLTEFIARSIVQAVSFLKENPVLWILTGGGTNNPVLVRRIKQHLNASVKTADEFGWDKESFGAQGYAFLAVRSLMGLPVSFPETTGVSEPVTGGLLHMPEK